MHIDSLLISVMKCFRSLHYRWFEDSHGMGSGSGSIRCRHVGQDVCLTNQACRHSVWKKCLQEFLFSNRAVSEQLTRSSFSKSSRQITHVFSTLAPIPNNCFWSSPKVSVVTFFLICRFRRSRLFFVGSRWSSLPPRKRWFRLQTRFHAAKNR